MSDDSNAPADLSNSGIDLSQLFRPSWTVESGNSTARLAAKYDEGDRSERPNRQGDERRREGQNRGPGRDRDSRGPRPQSGGRDAKAGPGGFGKQQGSRDRDPAGDLRDRRREERRPEPVQKPILEGWSISLIPEHSALEAIAKQIRSRAKAYPLFELARLIVNLSDRYKIALKAESENSTKLFRVKSDGSLWTSRKGAIAHLLSKHLEKFYSRSSVTVEAPKGSYSVVAQCGMSGILLGPPNHHEYQSRLLALHASRFKNLPFEVYKTRIKMMRDEALMEQWKTEQSTRTVFIPVESGSEVTPPVAENIEAIPVIPETSEAFSETLVEEISTTPDVIESAPVAEESEAVEPSEPAEAAFEESPVAEVAVSEGPQLSLEEATEHFHRHHAENEVEEVASEVTLPGRIALHESDPLLHDLLIKTLQELDRFPLPLAQVIGKELSSNGLQIFKAQKKIIHVSVARPRYLDRATTPTSEGFRGILDYLEAHPNQHRDKQWAELLALRTEPAGEDAEAIHRREQALGTDLLWLLHQGHVLDFAMGNLQAALRPVQQQKPVQTPATSAKPTPENTAPEANTASNLVIEEESVIEKFSPETASESIAEAPTALEESSIAPAVSTEPEPPLHS